MIMVFTEKTDGYSLASNADAPVTAMIKNHGPNKISINIAGAEEKQRGGDLMPGQVRIFSSENHIQVTTKGPTTLEIEI